MFGVHVSDVFKFTDCNVSDVSAMELADSNISNVSESVNLREVGELYADDVSRAFVSSWDDVSTMGADSNKFVNTLSKLGGIGVDAQTTCTEQGGSTTISSNTKIEFVMPSSEIMFWKRVLHKYVHIHTHIYIYTYLKSFFSKTQSMNLVLALQVH